MAILNKEKYLKDIAALVQKNAMDFEAKDRPSLMMDGTKVWIGSVAYDHDSGQFSYTVQDEAGREYASAHGMRPLSGLDVKTLRTVSEVVTRYAGLRRERGRNLVNIDARLGAVNRSRGAGVKL